MTKGQEFIERVKEKPLKTNRINVEYNQKEFFQKYQIISYWSKVKEYRNLAYERLSDIPVLSVTGLKAHWSQELSFPTIRFFVLVEANSVLKVFSNLKKITQINSTIDNLEKYDEDVKKRIIASLAINSLGKRKNNRMMYNDASLLICDDKNFLIPKGRQELVCLKIQVNEFLNLSASTTSFSHPENTQLLFSYINCVFEMGKMIDGTISKCLKPIVIKNVEDMRPKLQSLYIQKKKFKGNKNTVPYLPLDTENYTRGKLYALSEVVNAVNEEYKGLLSLHFCTFIVKDYDEERSDRKTNLFLSEYFSGKSIYCIDPFQTEESQKVITDFTTEVNKILKDKVSFVNHPSNETMAVRLCMPSEDDSNSSYNEFPPELTKDSNALQHLTFYNKKCDDKMNKAKARRILLELIIKDSLLKRTMPTDLLKYLPDWQFIKYKINEDTVKGGSLQVLADGEMKIDSIGFKVTDVRTDITYFFNKILLSKDLRMFTGAGDFHVMKKGNNVYMIYDTEEIPIFDTDKLNDIYEDINNGKAKTSYLKRKKESHEYLQGYVGCTQWETEGLKGSKYASYSYFSGINNGSLRFYKSCETIDKMPRARRIFVLHAENEAAIETDIKEIISMLKYGFGRWGELMTYPLPYKFLTEYLEMMCLATFGKHWSDIALKGYLNI